MRDALGRDPHEYGDVPDGQSLTAKDRRRTTGRLGIRLPGLLNGPGGVLVRGDGFLGGRIHDGGDMDVVHRYAVHIADIADHALNLDEFSKYNVATQADSAALEAMKVNEQYDSFKDKVKEYKSYDTAILDMKVADRKSVV